LNYGQDMTTLEYCVELEPEGEFSETAAADSFSFCLTYGYSVDVEGQLATCNAALNGEDCASCTVGVCQADQGTDLPSIFSLDCSNLIPELPEVDFCNDRGMDLLQEMTQSTATTSDGSDESKSADTTIGSSAYSLRPMFFLVAAGSAFMTTL
jgi:hypothetical protein